MKVMNVAVVGAGIYGINHVNAYTWNPNTNLVAVCDLNKEITDRIAEQYNVKTYNDVNEMLDNEEIDAVSIATPDAFHMDPALAADPSWKTNSGGEAISNNIRRCKENFSRS